MIKLHHLSVIVMAGLLCACQSMQQNVASEYNSIEKQYTLRKMSDKNLRPIKPVSARRPVQVENYYDVPEGKQANASQVDIIPPGSALDQHQKRAGQQVRLRQSYEQSQARLIKAVKRLRLRVLEQDKEALYVVDAQQSQGKVTMNTPVYQLRLKKLGPQLTELSMLDASDQPLKDARSRHLFSRIKKQMR